MSTLVTGSLPYPGPSRLRLLLNAVFLKITANDCTAAGFASPSRHKIPGVRIGVGLSSGITFSPGAPSGTATGRPSPAGGRRCRGPARRPMAMAEV
jgi:hypothetical protein